MGKKIVIMGYSGSGKSTLARKLGDKYQCEVLHLDCVHWLPGWKEREAGEQNGIVASFMDTHDSWVIDGNYQSTCFDRRIEEATQIILLLFPVHICLWRVIRRFLAYRGKSRQSMTEGCNEKIDREFLWWILHRGRDKQHRERYQKIHEQYGQKTVLLKNPKAVKRFLNTLE